MPVEHAGKNNKNKITQLEWFGNLSVEERKLAVSTIFPIKKEGILHDLTINISECQNSSHDLESQEYGDRFFNSNSDYLSHSRFGSRSQYASINTMSVQRGFISRHITFTDTFAPEDTLTVEDELVKNIEVFSDILESNKAKVNDFMAKSGRARWNVVQSRYDSRQFSFSDDSTSLIENHLCAKIWWLVEIAYNASYSKYVNGK